MQDNGFILVSLLDCNDRQLALLKVLAITEIGFKYSF